MDDNVPRVIEIPMIKPMHCESTDHELIDMTEQLDRNWMNWRSLPISPATVNDEGA